MWWTGGRSARRNLKSSQIKEEAGEREERDESDVWYKIGGDGRGPIG